MALTMRPTGLGHGVYKDDIDFSARTTQNCAASPPHCLKTSNWTPSSAKVPNLR